MGLKIQGEVLGLFPEGGPLFLGFIAFLFLNVLIIFPFLSHLTPYHPLSPPVGIYGGNVFLIFFIFITIWTLTTAYNCFCFYNYYFFKCYIKTFLWSKLNFILNLIFRSHTLNGQFFLQLKLKLNRLNVWILFWVIFPYCLKLADLLFMFAFYFDFLFAKKKHIRFVNAKVIRF